MGKKINFNFNKMFNTSLSNVGTLLVRQGRYNMDKISYGRTYVINGKKHIASRWGDTANNLTGDLRSTIRYDIQGHTLVFGAGNQNIDYAKYLEKSINRPNIPKSVEQNRNTISKIIGSGFRYSIV